jgi:hypothetical protein
MNGLRINSIAACALAPFAAIAWLATPAIVQAQRPPASPPPSAREAAPVDLTGQWVSVISEDWRWRMVTPTRGDFASIPLNAEGVRVGREWDPDADLAAGLECKAYGAPAIMRRPGRVRISWTDDDTLQIETDAGSQTRRLRFGIPPTTDEPRSRQGYSAANWEQPPRGAGAPEAFGIFSGRIGRDPQSLEVTTTNLLPGYYRKNGPPYSANTVLQEYFDYHQEANGDEWFTVTTIVTDPTYLDGVFITSSDFKKEQGTDGWNPTPCTVR